MRSTTFLLRVIFIAAFLTTTAQGQDNSNLQLRSADSPVSSPPITGTAITFDEAPVEAPLEESVEAAADSLEAASLDLNSAASSLQQEYLMLAKAKAALMDEAALKHEIQQTQKNIDELRALQKLQEAQRLLLSLKAEYPDSEAATKATQMLDAIETFTEFSSAADDLGPPLNTAAGEPYHRSSFTREIPAAGSQAAERQTAELPRLMPEPEANTSPSSQNGEPRTISNEIRTFRSSEPKRITNTVDE